MTCIVGISGMHGDKTVWMGGDSVAVSDWTTTTLPNGKLFRVGPCLIGVTGKYRESQLLEYRLEVPPFDGQDLDRFMAVDFSDAVRQLYKDSGWLSVENSREAGDGAALIGIHGTLYTLYSNFECSRIKGNYNAIGGGRQLAFGSLYTTSRYAAMDPQSGLAAALEAAATFNMGVAPPFTFMTLEESFTASTYEG